MSNLTSLDELFKQPTESRIFGMNFESVIDNDTITILNHSITSSPSGLTISNDSTTGQEITMSIAGGTAGTNYRIQVTIECSDGQIIVGDGILKVRDR